MTRNGRMPTDAFLKRLKENLTANSDKYPHLHVDSVFSEVSQHTIINCLFKACILWPSRGSAVCSTVSPNLISTSVIKT